MTKPLPEQAKKIIKCCRNGQLAQLQELLSQGVDYQLFDEWQFAPLNTALKYGRWQIARYLFKENLMPFNNKTPPIIAAAQSSKDQVTGLEIVFAHTGNTDATDSQGRTALMTASLLGHEKKVLHLLKNTTQINAADSYGMSAFLDAVVNQSLKICDLLLKHGANPHQVTEQGDNAMTLLMQDNNPNPRLIKKLLAEQVDLNHKNHAGHSALSLAQTKHKKLHQVLLAHIEAEKQMELPIFAMETEVQNTKPLHKPVQPQSVAKPVKEAPVTQPSAEEKAWFDAAIEGNLGQLNRLKIKGVDVNCTDRKGCTALIHAAGSGNRAAASFLIQNQAHIEHASDNGSTALSSAIISNAKAVVELLLNNGADPSGVGPGGYPYISLAAAQWNAGIISILANAGADVHTLDPNQFNLYHNVMLAAEYYSNTIKAKDTIRVIHHLGLNINQADAVGNTPLHVLCGALKEKNFKGDDSQLANLAHELLKLGASSSSCNKKGFTPLQYAKKHHLLNTKGVMRSFMS